MVVGGRPEPGKRRRARAASAVVPLPRPAAGDRLDLARLVPSGPSLLLAFAILGGAFAAFWGARASSVFAVERVEVRGAPASVQHEVERATRDVLGTSLLAVDTSAVEGAVTSLHSIAAASVDRAFPHTLVVRVAPVRVVGVAVRGDHAWIVGASNRAIRAIDPRAERGLPRFWLPRRLRVEAGRALPAAYEPVTRTLATLRDASIPARVKGVRATHGQIVVVLESGREILLGPAVDIAVKLAVAARVLPLLGDETRFLDVTVPERPVASIDLNSQVESESRG